MRSLSVVQLTDASCEFGCIRNSDGVGAALLVEVVFPAVSETVVETKVDLEVAMLELGPELESLLELGLWLGLVLVLRSRVGLDVSLLLRSVARQSKVAYKTNSLH